MREGQETPSYCMWRVVMLHLQLKFLKGLVEEYIEGLVKEVVQELLQGVLLVWR